MKSIPQPSRCEQLGVCQVYGTCTQCLMAFQRHPFAPGVIEADPESRSFILAVRVLMILAVLVIGFAIWVALDLGGLMPHLWLLVS